MCFDLLQVSLLFALIHLSSAVLPPYIGGWWFASWNSGERRANQELLQYWSELLWKCNKIKILFRIQSFHPTNMDFIIRHSCFPRPHSFFQLDPRYLFLRSKVLARDPKLLLRIQGFTSGSKDPIQFNIPILEFEHVASLKDCCSKFLNQGKNFFCAGV